MYYGHSPNGYSDKNVFNFQTQSVLQRLRRAERRAAEEGDRQGAAPASTRRRSASASRERTPASASRS